MYFVYILYSKQIDKFYIGQTLDLDNRMMEHNTGRYEKSFTNRADDWSLYFKIDCYSIQQAIKIEKHLKNMRNRKYYSNLTLYPELTQ